MLIRDAQRIAGFKDPPQEYDWNKPKLDSGRSVAMLGQNISINGRAVAAFENELSRRVINQPQAVKALVNAYKGYITGLRQPGRPISNLIFLGPTGSGKTHTVESAAAILTGFQNHLIKIDCAEFQHNHEIAKLIGSPPGYIGHRETAPVLTQTAIDSLRNEKCGFTFVLFDEIEKACDALWQLLLGILDKATLKLGDNTKVDFADCIIVMTSNLGAREMARMQQVGFTGMIARNDIKSSGIAALKKAALPEFVNRLDETVVFNTLQSDDLKKILELELTAVQDRILHAKCAPFILYRTPAVDEFLLKHGVSSEYGARELKRAIQKHLVTKIMDELIAYSINPADTLTADIENGEIVIQHSDKESLTAID